VPVARDCLCIVCCIVIFRTDLLFSRSQVLNCLPRELPWSIPDREFEYRRDLRSQCIFTIDPSTARDLDDAVSCEDLGDGLSLHVFVVVINC